MPKIAVYAGHGGTDPGAVYENLQEKDFTLKVSNYVTKLLREKGYEVINNRTTDTNRSITKDANFANDQNVDAVVEIHLNSSDGPVQSGTETYYSVYDTGKGERLAQEITDNIADLGFINRGIKTRENAEGNDYFGIIRLPEAPAVLVETAFINSPKDMENYDVPKISEAIASGIETVFPKTAKPSIPSGNKIISQIQQTLNNRYDVGLVVNGLKSKDLKKALVTGLQTELNEQFNAGLVVDGIIGPKTKAAIQIIKEGARGNLVYLIQAALYLKEYNVFPDGVFGEKTKTAIKAFQNDNNLTVDGIAGKDTIYKLFS